ncbi:MAG: type II toxin-antitoxin system VapC family toxin [Magnetospirillum sp. WYHS-4]
MKALLDTHAFLWWIADDPRLSDGARRVLADADNDVAFSVASAWEIAIKAGKGLLILPRDPASFVAEQVAINGFRILPVGLDHALGVMDLAPHHRDPFDRLLVAQCRIENLPLVTCDPLPAAYGIATLW